MRGGTAREVHVTGAVQHETRAGEREPTGFAEIIHQVADDEAARIGERVEMLWLERCARGGEDRRE